jgi:tRNA threonylcarbamoyladenosine biosynthesis protein TsaE
VTDVVNSPTFALVNEYETEEDVIYHFDLYRITKTEELYDIGYEEYLYSGKYCFIEWPEKMAELLPKSYVYISIEEQDDGFRHFEVEKIH